MSELKHAQRQKFKKQRRGPGETPSMDAPAEEWGRLAQRISGSQWMPGMFLPLPGYGRLDDDDVSDHPLYRLPLRHADECWPDPDDGPVCSMCDESRRGADVLVVHSMMGRPGKDAVSTTALSRWPGQEDRKLDAWSEYESR